MRKGKEKRTDKIGIGKFWAWNSRPFSFAANTVVLGFVSIYCTDTLMMSPMIVGVLLMVSKIVDAFTDLCAGYLVDKTNTKLGKARPYELAVIGMWLATWLMFSASPEWSDTFKYIWLFTTYVFINSIFVTLLNANSVVYMVRVFDTQKKIVDVSSYGGIISFGGAIIIGAVFPTLMATIATSASGWSRLMAIVAVPMTVIGLLRFIFVPETVEIKETKSSDSIRVKDVLAILKNNKYIYIVCLFNLVVNLAGNMGVDAYYFKYIVENPSLQGMLSLASIAGLPLLLVLPVLSRKLSVIKTMELGVIAGIAGFVLYFFAGGNIVLIMLSAVLKSLATMPISYLSAVLVIQCGTYNEWKNMPRMEGTLNSVLGFSNKLGSALGVGLVGAALSLAGYSASMTSMPSSVLLMIRILAGIIPAVLYIIMLIVMRFYDLEKKEPELKAEIEKRRLG